MTTAMDSRTRKVAALLVAAVGNYRTGISRG